MIVNFVKSSLLSCCSLHGSGVWVWGCASFNILQLHFNIVWLHFEVEEGSWSSFSSLRNQGISLPQKLLNSSSRAARERGVKQVVFDLKRSPQTRFGPTTRSSDFISESKKGADLSERVYTVQHRVWENGDIIVSNDPLVCWTKKAYSLAVLSRLFSILTSSDFRSKLEVEKGNWSLRNRGYHSPESFWTL
jgi:hypothetical protein